MTKRSTSVQLGRELDALIQLLIERGDFANTSEVIRAGLRALEAQTVRRLLTSACPCADGPARADVAAAVRRLVPLVEGLQEPGLAHELRDLSVRLERRVEAPAALRRAAK